MIISSFTAQGNREYQEDRFVIRKTDDGTLLAVFDGHGGAETASWCKHLTSKYDASTESSFRRLFSTLAETTEGMREGTTASMVFIPNDENSALIGVLGDSPVLVQSDTLWLSPEHNVRTNLVERAAAEARGGRYADGYMCTGWNGLQMSRAFGDSELKFLSREPEIFNLLLIKGGYVLVATDGVFDPGHQHLDAEVQKVKTLIEFGADAEALVNRALDAKTGDNATCILARF